MANTALAVLLEIALMMILFTNMKPLLKKVKEQERKEFFAVFGTPKEANTPVAKLQKVIQSYEQHLSPDVLKKLEKTIQKIKRQHAKKKLTKEEAEKALQKLKEMIFRS